MPPAIPRAPRAIPLLIAGAVLSMALGLVVDRAVFFVYSTPFQSRLGLAVQIATEVLIPAALVVTALLRVPAPRRNRVIAVLLAVVAIPPLLLVLAMPMPRALPLSSSVAPVLLLAAWATVRRPRPAAWLLVAAPALVVAALLAGGILLSVATDLPASLRGMQGETEGLILGSAPILTAIACGAVMARSAPRRAGAVPALP